MTEPTFTPDVPGRGAWRTRGGLLPLTVGSTRGYYMMAGTGQRPVGSAWITGADKSDSARCVNQGVKVIQELLNDGLELDGWFGAKTATAVTFFQRIKGLDPDGIVGAATMKTLLTPVINNAASVSRVPYPLLCGIATHESGLDPAAVGSSGYDHGTCQINLGVHLATVGWTNSMTPGYALPWTGNAMRAVYDRWAGKTAADPWDIAVANHNSPKLAAQWAYNGTPPYVAGRVIQIADYVAKVKTACK